MSAKYLGFLAWGLGLVFAPATWGQPSQWQNLAQVKAGTRVQVVEQSLKSISGKFLRFSDTDLTLRVEDRELVIPKDRVYRVSISGKNRKRNALIGLAAGSGIGLGVGLALLEREKGFGGAVAGVTVAYAAVGAGVGAVVPAGKTIYQAERSGQASVRAGGS
jgi:hypothetical protein